jgi:hypothetical protein
MFPPRSGYGHTQELPAPRCLGDDARDTDSQTGLKGSSPLVSNKQDSVERKLQPLTRVYRSRPARYAGDCRSPASRARRSFSRIEACSTEMDVENDTSV